jgi:hypothetical protein
VADDELLKWLHEKARTPEEIESRVLGIFSPPGFGKTVLAAHLGERVLYITDEMQGAVSIKNHPELKGKTKFVPFSKHRTTARIIRAVEAGDFVHDDGEPFDTIVLDTLSGMASLEVQNIIKSGMTGQNGRVSVESSNQPDYHISERRIMELMAEVANLSKVTTVVLFHQRVGDKLTPGDLTRADVHAAAFRVVNKYASVIAYLTIKDNKRQLQVMPNGNGVSVKSRYRFPSEFVTPDEFVAHIRKWKENI